MGREEELQKQKQTSEIKVTKPAYEEVQNPAWMMIDKSQDTAQGTGKHAADYSRYDELDLKGLRDELLLDKSSKSEAFMDMYNAVNDLINLAMTGGKFKVGDEEMTADFFETFYTARMFVSHYLYTRDGFHWTGKGERRIQIVRRLADILGRINGRIEDYKASLPEEKARQLEYRQQGLSTEEMEQREEEYRVKKATEDMVRIADLGEYGPKLSEKEKSQLAEKWLVKGYSEQIKELINGQSMNEVMDKDDFIAFLEDRNNRLLANRIAISMMVDRANEVTHKTPWMREILRNHVTERLGQDALFTLKPDEVAARVNEIIGDYASSNRDYVERTEKRIRQFSKELHVPSDMDSLFEYPIMKQLIDESNDEEFEERVKDLTEQQRNTDAYIQQELNVRFSPATRAVITKKLIRNLGSLRLFGTESQIMDQCDRFFGMIRFIAPLEHRIENVILHTMQDNKIEFSRRDHFVTTITDGNPSLFLDKYLAGKEAIEQYAQRYSSNNKTFLRKADDKSVTYTEEQWEILENLANKAGEYNPEDFKDLVKQVTTLGATGEMLSRREYLSKRKFKDAEKMPARMRNARAEQKRIDAMKGSLDARFMLFVSGARPDAYLRYRKLYAAQMGKKDALKGVLAAESRRVAERTPELKNILRDHGISLDDMDAYLERFDPLMRGLREVSDKDHEDDRLQDQRLNLERYGVRDWNEAMLKIDNYLSGIGPDGISGQATVAAERYGAHMARMDEKFGVLSEVMLRLPDFRGILLTEDEKKFDAFLANELLPKFAPLLEAVESQKGSVPEAALVTYAYAHLDDVYRGTITGDAKFFADQLVGYSAKLLNTAPDGQTSAADNIKAAEKLADKEISKAGIKGAEADAIRMAVVASIHELSLDEEGFFKLYDSEFVKQHARDQVARIMAGVKQDAHKDDEEIKKALEKASGFHDPTPEIEETKKIEKIRREKKRGVRSRNAFLGLDQTAITKVRRDKSLIRVKEKGAELVSLNTAKADKMRGLVSEYCGDLELPQVLLDALVEGGASQSVIERATGTRMWTDTLYRHAFSMAKMYEFLKQDGKDDPAMSEEEAQMFIVKSYGDSSGRGLFDSPKGPDVAALRVSPEYKRFREEYKKLKAFEGIEITEPSLERERMDLSTDLRTVLMTGVGSRAASFGDLADNAMKYLQHSAMVSEIIRKRVLRFHKDNQMPDLYIDRQVGAVRECFMSVLVGEVRDGKEFDEAKWGKRVSEFYSDRTNRAHVEFTGNSVSGEDYLQAEQHRTDVNVTEKDIAEVIRSSEIVLHGRLNKYEKLDEDQKKLFVIALMMMDKGSIGLGTKGTSALLSPRDATARQNEEITKQIGEYVRGGTLNVNLNYKEALYKLVNFGKNGLIDIEHYAFSATAYDKALQFANALRDKRARASGRDVERMARGYASINSAYVNYGKPQQQYVDAISPNSLTIDDVRSRLIAFADKDSVSAKKMAATAATAGLNPIPAFRKLDKDAGKTLRMRKVKKRLKNLSDSDLKVFVRLMQERTIIDSSQSDADKVIDQEKRDALIEALSADTKVRAEVLDGFDDPESCKQALTTALSFKLKDDMILKGKSITRDCFDDESFNRDTVVDWTVVERVLDLMDEISEKKMALHAMSHATEYIAFAGNKAATDAYVKLLADHKDKASFKMDSFENLIKEHADRDKSEDVSRAVAGYHSLTDAEKRLFFKVLARRDFLDVSRKKYKSSFFGRAEREFANKAGRDALIDEYIDSSLEGNVGIQLDENSYFTAMSTLYSTQVSDRTNFSKTTDLTKIFANERQLFRGRATAIDWKLFKRALQFVNRASEELEFVEGNAQLYRAAGSLSKNGRIKMDYGFLRKNVHRTGQHWGRYLGQAFARTGKEIVGGIKVTGDVTLDKILDTAGDVFNTVDDMARLAFKKDGMVTKGTAWLRRKKDEASELRKDVGEDRTGFIISEIERKDKEDTPDEKAKKEAKEAARRAQLDFCDHLKEGVDNVIAQSKSVGEAFGEVAEYVKTNMIANSEKLKWFKQVDGAGAGQDGNNLVVRETRNAAIDQSHGDLRDPIEKGVRTAADVKKTAGDVLKIGEQIPGLNGYVKEIKKLVNDSAQKIAYKFLNDAIIQNKIDLTPKIDEKTGKPVMPDELELYKKNAENYAKGMFTSILKGTIGEEKAGKLLEAENYFYGIQETINDTMKGVMDGINYVKKCTAHVKNIAECADNLIALKKGSRNAAALRQEDDKNLEQKSRIRLRDDQKTIVDSIVAKHRGMKGLAEDLTTAVQAFNISEEVLNLTMETVSIAGGKLNAGQDLIAKAIREGVKFAMYAARLATDRVTLNSYYRDTEAGQAVVRKLTRGFDKTSSKSLKNANVLDLVDVISDARGYEHTSELIENTGMSVAQSIVFSASAYNPLAETRLVAITVMSVMGLSKEIGDTSADTVEKLFKSFKVSR